MKKLLSILLLILFSKVVVAQQESSLGVFISNPVGKMASTNLDGGGFAQMGWGLVFDSKFVLKPLPKGLTLFLHSTYQWNKLNTTALAEEYTSSIGYKTEVSNSKYSPLFMTIGPSYDFSISDKFSIGINATGGLVLNNTQAFTIKVYDNNNVQIVNELVNFEDKAAFAYTFGGEFKYNIIPDVFGISLYTDYSGANQKVETTSQNVSTSSFQKLQFVNVGFKLIFLKQ